MGREIRRVPKGWEHPKNWRGELQPMHDRVFDERFAEWLVDFEAFKRGEGDRQEVEEDYAKKGITPEQIAANPAYYFSKYAGGPPDYQYYRPTWAQESTCFQIYETVTEGTPASPVFETLDALAEWLVEQGYSRTAAEVFARDGWAPSGVIVFGKGYARDIHALDMIPRRR